MSTTVNGVQANHCIVDTVKPVPETVDKIMTEEKVEMSEVPLTTTEQAQGEAKPAEPEEPPKSEPKPEEAKEKEEKPSKSSRFRQFFSRERSGERKEKPAAEKEGTETAEKEGTEEKKPVEVPAEKPTKAPRRWFIRKPKEAKENGPESRVEEPQMTVGLNMFDRDERNLNEHVKLSFEDVFAEPDGYHSFDCAWRLTYRIFTATRSFVYRLLSLILAIPCALIWGILFALITVLNIWACVPCARCLTVPATWVAKAWNFFVRSILDPCFRSCGLCLGNVTIRRYGVVMESQPEAHLA